MGGGSDRPAFLMSATLPLLLLLTPPVLLVIFCAVAAVDAASSPALDQKCTGEVAKLMVCLSYANGQEAAPTDNCCREASDIQGKDPVCLCYVIQQAHEERFKNLGLQFSRLLQLPAACRLPNSNVTDCPRLLDIKPTSPEYSIFNTTAASFNTSGAPNSAGFMNQVQYSYAMTASSIASALVFSVFSS